MRPSDGAAELQRGHVGRDLISLATPEMQESPVNCWWEPPSSSHLEEKEGWESPPAPGPSEHPKSQRAQPEQRHR